MEKRGKMSCDQRVSMCDRPKGGRCLDRDAKSGGGEERPRERRWQARSRNFYTLVSDGRVPVEGTGSVLTR